jgi:hypothetical protein
LTGFWRRLTSIRRRRDRSLGDRTIAAQNTVVVGIAMWASQKPF